MRGWLLALAIFVGCGGENAGRPDSGVRPDAAADAGPRDLGPSDRGVMDLGAPDAGFADAEPNPDATVLDAEPTDTIPTDALPPDTTVLDAEPADALPFDASPPDATVFDATAPDALPPDTAVLDAMPPDALPPDATVFDAGTPDVGGFDFGIPDVSIPDFGPFDASIPDLGPFDAQIPDVGVLNLGVFVSEIRARGAPDAIEITNQGSLPIPLGSLQVQVLSQAGVHDLFDPVTGASSTILLNPGERAWGVAAVQPVPSGASFVIGAPSALPADFLGNSGDVITLSLSNILGSIQVDVVDFRSAVTDPTQPLGANDFPLLTNPMQLDRQRAGANGALDNDDGANWCVFGAGTLGAENLDCQQLVLNEVLYDYDSLTNGDDQGSEFVEIYGPAGATLSEVALYAVEGTGAVGTIDRNVPLVGRMPLDGFYVIGDANAAGATLVPNADLVVNLDLENGADAVQLAVGVGGTATVIDAFAYGAVTGLVGEGTAAPDPTPTSYSITFARRPDGLDTNNNATDFEYDPSPTPGVGNGVDLFALNSLSPNRGPVGGTISVTLSGVDFTDLMTFALVQTPPATITCNNNNPPAVNQLVCSVAYPTAGPALGSVVDATLIARPEHGGTSTLPQAFTWIGALNETNTPGECDYCNLQFPPTITVAAGSTTPEVYGQFYEAGVSEAAGPASNITAELGYGPVNSDPRSSSAWIWVPAVYNVQVGNNDEYRASFTAPVAGSYQYTFRFSQDGGLNYTYADTNGVGSNAGLDFELNSLGVLTSN